ncbi:MULTISPECIES: hypothetical protein [unclassified Streptomyces]|uniref:hypothetical protein n=1 Tax=unclassified Streptomyces TaxID=2593676 RepID=UPI002271DB5D|nr:MULTISPECIES: hypothetical protein [unclassified Streptomyces]MCY0923452.1 hypothetical protein [Streptomyces sp. H27-G5]MCY0961872.1 hypothetical protein [Streptomyces sp. H27-H5]
MRYLEGISLDAFGRGNRRMLAPVLAWAKEPVPVPVAAAEGPKAAEGEKPAKGSPARKPEKTPEPKTRRRIGARHLGYAAGGAFLLWPVVGGWVPTVLTTAPAVWVVAALIAGQQDDHDAGAEGDDDQEQPQAGEAGEADRGTALLLHVVGALAEAEAARRAGVHLDVVLDSAAAAGLLPQGTELSVLRTWVEGCGLPVEPKLGMRIEGKPVTRVGLRVDAATTALGMAPAALLAARSQAPVQTRGETPAAAPTRVPAQAVGEGPAEAVAHTPAEAPVPAPAGTPAPAVLRLIPGGPPDPDSALSPALSQGQAQEARQTGLSAV